MDVAKQLNLNRALSGHLEMEGLVEEIFRICQSEVGAEGCALYLRGQDDWLCQGQSGQVEGLAEILPADGQTAASEGPPLLLPLGRFCLLLARSQPFRPEQVELLQTLVPQLANSLEHARQFAQRSLELQEARHALRLRSAYLASMSHELRTPLNAVLGFCQILTRSPETTVSQVESLQHIQSNGRLLLDMISDVVEMSRLEAGLVQAREEPFHLGNLLREQETNLSIPVVARGRTLSLQLEPDLPERLLGDADKIGQIVRKTSLASSQLGEGGTLQVRAFCTGAGAGQCQISLEIEDSAAEPELARLEKMFEPFSQLERWVGSGLELAIARHYAELMGGALSVKNAEAGGLVWSVRFNARLDTQAGGNDPEASGEVLRLHPQQPPVRVLVVDDVVVNRFMLTRFLMPLGFEVREAENGQQALEIFADWQPHAVLTDLVMPGLSGSDMIREMRSQHQKVVIFAVTGAGEEARAEVDGHLPKPVDLDLLLRHLQSRLELRFLYREREVNDSDSAASLSGPRPTAEQLAPLRKAAGLGDVAEVSAQLGQLWRECPESQPFLQYCLHLADDFDFSRLEELVSP